MSDVPVRFPIMTGYSTVDGNTSARNTPRPRLLNIPRDMTAQKKTEHIIPYMAAIQYIASEGKDNRLGFRNAARNFAFPEQNQIRLWSPAVPISAKRSIKRQCNRATFPPR
jgi:hypothetical protein